MGIRVRRHNGQYFVFVNYQKRRKAVACGSEREAKALASKLRTALARGEFLLAPEAPPLTLREFVATWRTDHAPNAIKASTLRGYNANLDQHVLPALGEKPLAAITRADCKALIAACRGKALSSKTLKNIVRTLSAILSEAVEDGKLVGNPAFRMGRYCKREDEIPHVIQPLSREEAAKLLAAARTHYAPWYPLVLTALRTGMRLGELLALEWGDIDWSGKFIMVRRSANRGKVTTTKSGAARRVDMSTQLDSELYRAHAQRRKAYLHAGRVMPKTVFLSPEGLAVDPDNFRNRVFERLVAKAGLRALRFHDLRHTYASTLIAAGVHLTYIKEQLGHSSIKITVDIYGHLIPGANRAAVDALDDIPCAPDATPRNQEGESPEPEIAAK